MEKIKNNNLTLRSTYISIGNEKRNFQNSIIRTLLKLQYNEIDFPILQLIENNKSQDAFIFEDRGICLPYTYTTVLENLIKTQYKKKEKIFYIGKVFKDFTPTLHNSRENIEIGVFYTNTNLDVSFDILRDAKILASLFLDDNNHVLFNKLIETNKVEINEDAFTISSELIPENPLIIKQHKKNDLLNGFVINFEKLFYLNNLVKNNELKINEFNAKKY